jgi:hypothetical protein
MFIGQKKIKQAVNKDNLTEIEYEDNSKEVISKLMYDATVSEKSCDLTQLREKRVKPIVEEVLCVLRNWGIKLSEIPYFSTLLTTSLHYNEDEALKELYSKWLPNIKSLDDIDLVTLDRILKSKKEKVIPSPY